MTAFLSAAPALYLPSPAQGFFLTLDGVNLVLESPEVGAAAEQPTVMGVRLPRLRLARAPLQKPSLATILLDGPIELSTPITSGLFAKVVDAASYGQAPYYCVYCITVVV